MSRRRASLGGCQNIKLSAGVAKKLIEVNNKNWGKFSWKKLAGELTSAGHSCSPASVRCWCKVLEGVRRRWYIETRLSKTHRANRLSWVLERYSKQSRKFIDGHNVSQGDEK